jgi:hypothetical protein
MRIALAGLLAFIVAGCAVTQSTDNTTLATKALRPSYIDAGTPSLAFSPPIAIGLPPLNLDREIRQPGVFLGYDELTTTYYHVRNDDWQVGPTDGRTFRRAVTERVGVSYR